MPLRKPGNQEKRRRLKNAVFGTSFPGFLVSSESTLTKYKGLYFLASVFLSVLRSEIFLWLFLCGVSLLLKAAVDAAAVLAQKAVLIMLFRRRKSLGSNRLIKHCARLYDQMTF